MINCDVVAFNGLLVSIQCRLTVRNAIVAPADSRVRLVESVLEQGLGCRVLIGRVCIQCLREQHSRAFGRSFLLARLREKALSLLAVRENQRLLEVRDGTV